jgi:glycosyltransferase involved in cell wall biosynthesis
LNLSVVIPCKDDPAVVACVDSVDCDVEIVIVLNGSPPGFCEDLERRLGNRARIEILPHANLSHALEHGIQSAYCDHIVLMDSDCVFAPGSLAAVDHAFATNDPDNEVYRGDIVFEPGSNCRTRLVARSRSRRMGARLCAYKPPLAFSRKLRERLGGYFFDMRLRWREDADLDQRVRRAGIRIVRIAQCRIHHKPLYPVTDLRHSFYYGVGEAIGRHLHIPLLPPNRSWSETFRHDGLSATLYLIALDAASYAGLAYGQTRLRISKGRWLRDL